MNQKLSVYSVYYYNLNWALQVPTEKLDVLNRKNHTQGDFFLSRASDMCQDFKQYLSRCFLFIA